MRLLSSWPFAPLTCGGPITTVAGNVDVASPPERLYTVELCGADVPVYSGADKPCSTYQNETWFHGATYSAITTTRRPGDLPEIYTWRTRSSRPSSNPGVVLVTLAPLTNVALALAKRPDIAGKVGRACYGWGTVLRRQRNPAAEYKHLGGSGGGAHRLERPSRGTGRWQTSRAYAGAERRRYRTHSGFNNALARFAIECNRHARQAYRVQTREDGIRCPIRWP